MGAQPVTDFPALKIQLHWLVDHPCALLNRDDNGNPKGLTVGGVRRHRASDAALKHAWRHAAGDMALTSGYERSTYSRVLLRREVGDALVQAGYPAERIVAVCEPFLKVLVGANDSLKKPGGTDPLKFLERREGVRLGPREVQEIRRQVQAILDANPQADRKGLTKAAAEHVKDTRDNLARMIDAAGADAALFGRYTTGNLAQRMDSALHLGHLLTVHEAVTETDYKAVVDDLLGIAELGHPGAANLDEPRLAGGIFYGYLSLDVATLIANTTGASPENLADADPECAAVLAERLIHLAASVAPRARQTQTASHASADVLLLEVTQTTPRNMMKAFTEPCRPTIADAADQLARGIEQDDRVHGRRALRALASTTPCPVPEARTMTRADLAATAGQAIREAHQVAGALPAPTGTPQRLWAA